MSKKNIKILQCKNFLHISHRITWAGEKNALNEIAEKSQDEISKRKVHSYLAYALIATVVTAVVLLVLLVMRKRIALVIQLFKEAGKAIASMPILLFEPIVVIL